jgi:hypothetical protein
VGDVVEINGTGRADRGSHLRTIVPEMREARFTRFRRIDHHARQPDKGTSCGLDVHVQRTQHTIDLDASNGAATSGSRDGIPDLAPVEILGVDSQEQPETAIRIRLRPCLRQGRGTRVRGLRKEVGFEGINIPIVSHCPASSREVTAMAR